MGMRPTFDSARLMSGSVDYARAGPTFIVPFGPIQPGELAALE